MTSSSDARILELLLAGQSLDQIVRDVPTAGGANDVRRVAQTVGVSTIRQRVYDLLYAGHSADDVEGLMRFYPGGGGLTDASTGQRVASAVYIGQVGSDLSMSPSTGLGPNPSAGGGGPPTGPAGGKLSGTYPNPGLNAASTDLSDSAALARLASPALTGGPTAPTQAPLDNSTKLGTTAYADAAVAVEATARANALATALAGLAPAEFPAVAQGSALTHSGVGQTVGGVVVTAGMRILDTANAVSSGLWVAAVGAWTRPVDFQTGSNAQGKLVEVDGGSLWVSVGTSAVTVDTTTQVWTQLDASVVQAGSGLSKTGNTLALALTKALVTATGLAAADVGADASGAASTEQTRALAAEALLAPKASPTFTGTPAAPTPAAEDNSTALATTAYVQGELGDLPYDAAGAAATEQTRALAAEALLAPKASPALTGTPTAPTPAALDNSTKLGTTAYADAATAVEQTRALAAEALLTPKTQTLPIIGSKMVAFGHSYLTGFGLTHPDRQFITMLAGLLRSDLRDLGVGGSLAANDQAWLTNPSTNVALPLGGGGTTGQGGWAWLLQNVAPYHPFAPYTPSSNFLPLICTGINDMQHANDGTGNPVLIFKTALRTHMSRLCASRVFEESDASVVLGGTGGAWQSKVDKNKNSGSSYAPIPGNGATFTITLPADYDGGPVAIGFTVMPLSDGQVAFTGTASQLPATVALAGLAYAAGVDGTVQNTKQRHSSNGHVVRVTGLLASDAGKTIIGTFSTGAGTRFATPATPGAVTNVGAAGSTTYTYERVYRTYNGDTIPSATVSTATGNAALSGSNYNQIPAGPAWPTGVEAELIVRTVGGTPGIVATLTTGPAIVNDQATVAAGGAYSAVAASPLLGGAALDYWQIESSNPSTYGTICNVAQLTPAEMTTLSLTGTQVASYNTAITQLVAEFAAGQWTVIDINTALGTGTAANFYSDGIHPNERGQANIASAAYTAIQQMSQTVPMTAQIMQSRRAKSVTSRGLQTISTVGTFSVGTAWADIDSTNLLQVSLDAQVGDTLEVVLNGLWAATATQGNLDACTTTGAAGNVISYFLTGSSTPVAASQPGWLAPGVAQNSPIAGSAFYVVQPQDLVPAVDYGLVIVKIRGFVNSGTRAIYAGSFSFPFTMMVKNLGGANTPGFNAS